VLDTNPNTVATCRVEIPIELGDATRTEVLQHAGAGASLAIIVTVPDPNACRVIVGVAQRIAPGVPIVARLRYHQFAQDLARAGADRVVDEEYTVGIRLAEEALLVASRIQ
jgi:monovalent cation:H+ antiporter-2, CPA2 family